jgi:DNA-binding transcriptional regulator YhcF (GntR family)
LCFDRDAHVARKENKPASSARDMANEIGVQLLTEKQYRELQEFEVFDLKTSSWIDTPEKVRKL